MPPSSRFLAPALAALCLGASANAAPLDPGFDRFADSLFAAQLEAQHIPGAVLVVARDGSIAFARGFGWADLERRVPVDAARTMFRVASVSKLFTATAAIQCVEEGRLDLHADVNRYLPFRIPLFGSRPVTLFDLLTHTGGFDESNLARKAWRPEDVEPLGDYLARRLPPRVRAPGDLIAYSNHGMALAGLLVEIASGKPFERAIQERVFAPLDMRHSSFDALPDSAALLATGYAGNPPRPVARDYTRTIPASMLAISGMDVGRFMLAHLEGELDGRRILSDSGLAMMHRRQFTQHAALAGIGFGFWERFQNGERALWHDGDASGVASLLYLLPDRHIGYFMAFNSRAGSRARRDILAALLEREFPRPASPAAVSAPDPDFTDVAGTYVDSRHARRSMEKIASLASQVTVRVASGALVVDGRRYLPAGGGVFRGEDGEGAVALRRNGHAVADLYESRSIAKVWERVPWYGTPTVQLAWLGLCVVGFLWCAIGTAFAAVRRGRGAGQGDGGPRWPRFAVVAASALDLAFLIGLTLAIGGVFGSLEYGIPVALRILLAVPIATTALAVAAAGKHFAARGLGSRSIALVAGTLAVLAFIPWLAYWNLLGWRF